jgi:hypothetical protein
MKRVTRVALILVALVLVTFFSVIAWRELPPLLGFLVLPLLFPRVRRSPPVATFARWLRGSGGACRVVAVYVLLVCVPTTGLFIYRDLDHLPMAEIALQYLRVYAFLVPLVFVPAGMLILFTTRTAERFSRSPLVIRLWALMITFALAFLPLLFMLCWLNEFTTVAICWITATSLLVALDVYPQHRSA